MKAWELEEGKEYIDDDGNKYLFKNNTLLYYCEIPQESSFTPLKGYKEDKRSFNDLIGFDFEEIVDNSIRLKMTYNMLEGRIYKVVDMDDTRLRYNGHYLLVNCGLGKGWTTADPLYFQNVRIELLPVNLTKKVCGFYKIR